LGSRRLKADHLTALGLLLAAACAVVIALGHLMIGLFILILAAVPDLLDGAVAKATGTASVRGAFFDSVSDRVVDSLILGGIAWHLASSRHAHWALLPLAVLAVSNLISYERAKAESLGFTAKGGLMERAERIIVLCAGLAFSVILVPLLWAMLVLSSITAIQRFVKVWRQASKPPAPKPVDQPVAMAERWRAWREANGAGTGNTFGNRFARGTRPSGRIRWQERRQTSGRTSDGVEGAAETPAARRRQHNRRP
jgi:CDP-diacylglycerol--glycerol-3-phosphate 3-phosphatidyltransferase